MTLFASFIKILTNNQHVHTHHHRVHHDHQLHQVHHAHVHDHHQGRRLVEVLQPSGEELQTSLAGGGQDHGAVHVQQVVFLIIIFVASS